MGCDFTPVRFQCAEYFLITACTDAGTHQYDQVDASQFRLIEAEAFPYQALDAITFDRVAGIFYRHDGAKARMVKRIVSGKHGDIPVTDLEVAMPEDLLEIRGCQQTVRRRIRGAGARQGDRSDRKTRATFCPASLDDKTAVLGAHTGTETVCTLALQVARLECSLHGANRSQKRLKARKAGQIRPRRLLSLPCRCQPPEGIFILLVVVDKSPVWR